MASNEKVTADSTYAEMWDEQYALCPTLWKGPYNLTPITQRVIHGAHVLDVGCGVGRYLVPLARNGFRVVGADLSRQALTLLARHYVRVVVDIQQLPFQDESFDAVTCFGVLQHLTLAGRKKAVAELFRVLVRQGTALVEVTGRSDMRSNGGKCDAVNTLACGKIPNHHFSPSELCALFRKAGLMTLHVDEKITTKRYHGAIQKRHRIFAAMRKTSLL